ncbi:hypothetical protein SOVF_051800 [Spinacia oleracea]|nr:hypothetical protein SOVF_051800 [Spinacia oleracea]
MKNMMGCFFILGLVMMSGIVDAAVFPRPGSVGDKFMKLWGHGQPSQEAAIKKFLMYKRRMDEVKELCERIAVVRKRYSSEERTITKFPNYKDIVNFSKKFCKN